MAIVLYHSMDMYNDSLPCHTLTFRDLGLGLGILTIYINNVLRAVERVTLLRFLFGMHPYYKQLISASDVTFFDAQDI